MSASRKRNPDHALQRTVGIKGNHSNASNNLPQIYAPWADLQTRHLNRRFGLTGGHARLIAGLIFGEGK